MKRNLGFYAFTAGLVALVVQFLIILFGFINGDNQNEELFAVVDPSKLNGPTFGDIIKATWSGLLGVLVLIVLFVRRFIKGTDALMVVMSVLLWVIQILSLRTEGADVSVLISAYPIGILGVGFVIVSVFCDLYYAKYYGDGDEKK